MYMRLNHSRYLEDLEYHIKIELPIIIKISNTNY